MTRLALALLVLAGFAAPATERERDGVVQTSGAARAVTPARASFVEAQALTPPPRPRGEPSWTPFAPSSERRYLLHRSWLL